MLEAQSGPHAGDDKALSKEKKQDFLLSFSSFCNFNGEKLKRNKENKEKKERKIIKY